MINRFLKFIDDSPTPYHAVQTTIALLEPLGFTEVSLRDAPVSLPAGFRGFIRDGGTISAFRVGSAPAVQSGFRIVAAHTDSPNLRIKPNPVIRSHGYVRLGVEVYGGVTIATWADRDLGIAGRVSVRKGGSNQQVLLNIDRPVCRIPNVAIHLNRGVNEEGLKLNAQRQLPALLMTDDESEDPFRDLLAEELGCEASDIVTWDLMLYDLTKAALGGWKNEFIYAARLDNLASSHAAIEGLIGALDTDSDATAVISLFDHEEIGSNTVRGAASHHIRSVLGYLLDNSEPQGEGTLSRALANSFVLSADMAHAIHPGFADKHDDKHGPVLNGGPVIKQNANYRYTTEAEGAARFAALCEAADIELQWFVSRSDMRCGSTVGPMLASNLGAASLDVGNPMLSMHSVREMSGAHDHPKMAMAMQCFLLA